MGATKPKRQGLYRIGEIAKELGLTPQAIRYYEQEGLIPEPERTASGYRIYSDDARARLLFLKRAQQFGFKLEEIKSLLGADAGRRGSCARVKSMLDAKLAQLEEQFRQMKQLQSDLLRLRKQCEEALGADASCPVIIDFSRTVTHGHARERDSKRHTRS